MSLIQNKMIKKNLIFATNEKTGWKVVGVMFDEEITQVCESSIL